MRAGPVPLALCVLAACADIVVPPEPEADPVAVFDALWAEFDARYAYFELKAVDWESAHRAYRPRLSAATSEQDLFAIMAEMLASFRDGHITLWSPFEHYQYLEWHTRYPSSFDPGRINGYMLAGGTRALAGGQLRYAQLTQRIGYVRIGSFGGSGWSHALDEALAAMPGIDALIIDVRDNGGGSDLNSRAIAGRFTDNRRAFLRFRYRNGPGHDDFGPTKEMFIEPAGSRFDGPVAVLTNRACFSATESFVLAMLVLPQAFTVGDTTGGGFGNPYWRELPNGWAVSVPRWQATDLAGRHYEGVGVPASIPVRFDPSGTTGDPILETAVAELNHRIGAATSGPRRLPAGTQQ